jgi:hypothetical protein
MMVLRYSELKKELKKSAADCNAREATMKYGTAL